MLAVLIGDDRKRRFRTHNITYRLLIYYTRHLCGRRNPFIMRGPIYMKVLSLNFLRISVSEINCFHEMLTVTCTGILRIELEWPRRGWRVRFGRLLSFSVHTWLTFYRRTLQFVNIFIHFFFLSPSWSDSNRPDQTNS